MTDKKDEALKLALEAFEADASNENFLILKHRVREALAEQPAQQQQEPVAWVDLLKEAEKIVRGKVLWKRFIDGTPLANDIAVWMADFAQQHTSPPASKPWVGLSTDEIYDMYNEPRSDAEMVEFARAIEAKLREKNA